MVLEIQYIQRATTEKPRCVTYLLEQEPVHAKKVDYRNMKIEAIRYLTHNSEEKIVRRNGSLNHVCNALLLLERDSGRMSAIELSIRRQPSEDLMPW